MISKKYEEKLNEVLSIYENNHLYFYFNKSKEEVKEFINDYINNNDINSEEDFAYFIRCIIKQALDKYDSHTRFKRKEKQMPLMFKYLNDGYYVIKCAEGYEEYLYSKLEGINNIPIEKIVEEISASTCYSTKEHLLSEIENHLRRTEIFLLPSISKDHLTYQLTKYNQKINLNVDYEKEYEYDIQNKENYSIYPRKGFVVLTYNSCKDFDKMKATVEELKQIIKDEETKNFVLDLRGNTGGNSSVINPLIDYLKESNLNIVTLIDRNVFSSGVLAVEDMKTLGSTFIGEDISTSVNHFGESKNEKVSIDDKQFTIQYSSKYFDYNDENLIQQIPKNKLNKNKLELKFVHPDIYVNETIQDIKMDKDAYIEEVKKYFDSKYKSMMTKEEYDKLNNYYNELILGLNQNDGFFVDNFYMFGSISANILGLLDGYDFGESKTEDKFTFLEIYEKAKEIIKNINPDYLDEFSKLVDSGKIIANYERLNVPRKDRNPDNSCYRSFDDTINFEHSFTYDAIPALIHEYFHKLNYSKNKARYILTEYISIYFELYSYEYLKNQKIDSKDLNLDFRLNILRKNSLSLSSDCFYLYTYKLLGNFDEDTYKYIDYYRISKEIFELELKDRLKYFEDLEYKYNNTDVYDDYTFREYLANMFNYDYRYVIGTLLAYYSLYYKTKEDVLRLNEAFINNKEITLNEALKVIDIQLGSDTITKIIYSVKKYMNDNNLNKNDEHEITK